MEATNPSREIVQFNNAIHQYKASEKILTPVTRFVNSFFPEFDAKRIAKRYAAKHGLDVADVLAEWKANGQLAATMGTAVHRYAEVEIQNLIFDGPQNNHYDGYYRAVDRVIAKLLKRFEFINTERIVFSVKLGLAGTIDLLMRDPENDDILIFDWKTNKEITTQNSYNQFALSPIGHLDNCHFAKYSLQLNTYKRIMQAENYFPGAAFRMALIHLENNGEGTVTDKWFKVRDMDDEIDSMIEWI